MKGKITISRPNYSDCREVINITVQCVSSGIQFLDLEMTLKDFAKAITGQGYIPVEMEVRGLEFVGLTSEREDATVTVTQAELKSLGYDTNKGRSEALSDYLKKHASRDGWIVNAYLGSQGSVITDGDKVKMNFSYTRYVKPERTS